VVVQPSAHHEREAEATRVTALDWRPALHLALALVFMAAVAVVVWTFARPLALLVLAITIAQAVAPLVSRGERYMPRTAAVVVVYAAFVAAAAVLGWLLVPTLADQAQQIAQQLPSIADRLRAFVNRWSGAVGSEFSGSLSAIAAQLTSYLVTVPQAMLSGVIDLIVVLFLSVYWLIEAPDIRRFVLSMRPESARAATADVLDEMGDAMGGYVRGVVFNGLVTGALSWVGLWLLDMQYALALGAFTAVAELVPYFGALIAGALAAGAGLLISTSTAIQVVLLYTGLQQLENHLLQPNIMRSQTRVPAGVILFAFTAGFMVGGLLGGVVAIPIAAASRVFVVRVAAPSWRHSMKTRPAGARPGS
jgi:predicted PurR-regulated permease PerM